MMMIVCVFPDLTCLPLLGGGRKSWYIIICESDYACAIIQYLLLSQYTRYVRFEFSSYAQFTVYLLGCVCIAVVKCEYSSIHTFHSMFLNCNSFIRNVILSLTYVLSDGMTN